MCSVMCSSISTVPYQTLTTFSLGYNSISDDGAEHLAGALITNQVDIGHLGCTSLCLDSKCDLYWQTITTLDLTGNDISSTGARHLAEALKINQARSTFSLHSL